MPFGIPFCLAERVGFEPTLPLRGKHDFQSCAFDQLSHLSTRVFYGGSVRRNEYDTRTRFDLQAPIRGFASVFFRVIAEHRTVL